MPFFKRDSKKLAPSSYQGSSNSSTPARSRSTGSVSLGNNNQSMWGVKGTSAPTGWSPSPSSPGAASYPGWSAPLAPPPLVDPRNTQKEECYAWFVAIDQDGSGTISPEELQSALISGSGLMFSSSTVNYLMSIFGIDDKGIGFEEFEPLWNYISQWREMFESFDSDSDGKIDAYELGRALAHYDMRIGPRVLDLLVKKYAKPSPPRNRGPQYGAPPPQVDLDRFICACIVVRQMCQLYEQCSGSGPAQISRDDFIAAVISLP